MNPHISRKRGRASDESTQSCPDATRLRHTEDERLVEDMLNRSQSLDLPLLLRYTDAVLADWTPAQHTFKLHRLALWSVLRQLFDRAAEEGDGRAQDALGEMKMRVLLAEWARINQNRERRDSDYAQRVAVLLETVAVLLLRLSPQGAKDIEDKITAMVSSALEEIAEQDPPPSFDPAFLSLISTSTTALPTLVDHLDQRQLHLLVNVIRLGVHSDAEETVEQASKVVLFLLDRLANERASSSHFNGEHLDMLLCAFLEVYLRNEKLRHVHGFERSTSRLLSMSLSRNRALASSHVCRVIDSVAPSHDRMSRRRRNKLVARAAKDVDEGKDAAVALHRLVLSPPLAESRRRAFFFRSLIGNKLSRSVASGHAASHDLVPLHDAIAVPSIDLPFPYLAFSPILASFLSVHDHHPPLMSPAEIDAANRRGARLNLTCGWLADYVIRIEQKDATGDLVRTYVVKRSEERYGSLEEAEAMVFVRKATDIPVPELLAIEIHEGRLYRYMSFLPGVQLDEAWPSLSPSSKTRLQSDLTRVAAQLTSLPIPPGTPLGTLAEPFHSGIPSFHAPSLTPHRPTRAATLYDWVQSTTSFVPLILAKPTTPSSFPDPAAVLPLIFTHGDFAPRNILIDDQAGALTAVVDWELAGVWPAGVEESLILFERRKSDEDEELVRLVAGAWDAARAEKGMGPARADWLEHFAGLA